MPRPTKPATLERLKKQYSKAHEFRHIVEAVDPSLNFSYFSHSDNTRVSLTYRLLMLALGMTLAQNPAMAIKRLYCKILIIWFRYNGEMVEPHAFKRGNSFEKMWRTFSLTIGVKFAKTKAPNPLHCYAVRKFTTKVKQILVAFSAIALFPINLISAMSLITGGQFSPLDCLRILESFGKTGTITGADFLIAILNWLATGKPLPPSFNKWLQLVDLDAVHFSSADALKMLSMKTEEIFHLKRELYQLRRDKKNLELEKEKQRRTFRKIITVSNKTIASQRKRLTRKQRRKTKAFSPKRIRGGA